MLFLQFVYNQMFEECRMWHHPTTWQANEFLYDQGYDLIDIMANQRFYTANKLVEVIDIYIHKLKEGKKCKTVPFFRNMRDVFYFRFGRNTARTLKKMWEQLAMQSNVLFFLLLLWHGSCEQSPKSAFKIYLRVPECSEKTLIGICLISELSISNHP